LVSNNLLSLNSHRETYDARALRVHKRINIFYHSIIYTSSDTDTVTVSDFFRHYVPVSDTDTVTVSDFFRHYLPVSDTDTVTVSDFFRHYLPVSELTQLLFQTFSDTIYLFQTLTEVLFQTFSDTIYLSGYKALFCLSAKVDSEERHVLELGLLLTAMFAAEGTEQAHTDTCQC
jgi:hypothetical protein